MSGFLLPFLVLTPFQACQSHQSSDWRLRDGESQHVSLQSNNGKIRSIIYVKGQSFSLRATGATSNAGAGYDTGGLIRIQAGDGYFYLMGLGAIIPRNLGTFDLYDIKCEKMDVSPDISTVFCSHTKNETTFSYVFSKVNGLISFTGLCLQRENRLCDYVLVKGKGLSVVK